ncbi:7-hydroxymethyl chlorophyll a reductase, chloroplastic [Tanacetum coccineum]
MLARAIAGEAGVPFFSCSAIHTVGAHPVHKATIVPRGMASWVDEELLYACKTDYFIWIVIVRAQWTGILTTIATEMLKSCMLEAVICVQK